MRSLRSAVALAVVVATPAFAQARLVITIGGSDKIVYLPAKLAERLGYFQAQGVEVELRSEAAGVEARDALLSGAVQGVVGFYDHTIALQAKGKLVQSVVQFTVAPGEALLVSARSAATLRSPADLRGRIVGVTGLGSSTSFLTHYLVLAHGLKPTEVNLVPAGAGIAALAVAARGPRLFRVRAAVLGRAVQPIPSWPRAADAALGAGVLAVGGRRQH